MPPGRISSISRYGLASRAAWMSFVMATSSSLRAAVRFRPDGAALRLSGQGGAGEGGGESGDLFVRIRIAPHPTFKMDGRDVTVEVPVHVVKEE